jgi:hypothetical protein
MIRLLTEGILVGYGVVLLWLLLPVPGTLLGMFLWYIARYLYDLRRPLSKRMREAITEERSEVARWKAAWADEHRAREVAEAHRNDLHITRRVV